MNPKSIIIVEGAQYGSEAKGAIAAYLCQTRKVQWAVRTGAVNAGHTVIYPDSTGQPVKMQQLPTGWINPTTMLVLGAGSFIHPEILADEISTVSNLTGEDIRDRLFIDFRAGLHLPDHQSQAKLEGRHHLIGATGKGCSVAITDKIRYRGRGYRLFSEYNSDPDDSNYIGNLQFCDTQQLLHDAYDRGDQILLEGTQGALLDLHLGPYPYTTHKQTSAVQWVVECGLAANMKYETILVARTFPIRVAGNSGPMPNEITWPNLARDINRKLMLEHLPQRVRTFAISAFEQACHEVANSGKYILPVDGSGAPHYDFHKWGPEMQREYRIAVSELHADALKKLGLKEMEELMQLFELTTVTKKLRRIAQWDAAIVREQCRYNRASSVALTFFNYWYPELWGVESKRFNWVECKARYANCIRQTSGSIQCPISMISTGPASDHIIEVPQK